MHKFCRFWVGTWGKQHLLIFWVAAWGKQHCWFCFPQAPTQKSTNLRWHTHTHTHTNLHTPLLLTHAHSHRYIQTQTRSTIARKTRSHTHKTHPTHIPHTHTHTHTHIFDDTPQTCPHQTLHVCCRCKAKISMKQQIKDENCSKMYGFWQIKQIFVDANPLWWFLDFFARLWNP